MKADQNLKEEVSTFQTFPEITLYLLGALEKHQ